MHLLNSKCWQYRDYLRQYSGYSSQTWFIEHAPCDELSTMALTGAPMSMKREYCTKASQHAIDCLMQTHLTEEQRQTCMKLLVLNHVWFSNNHTYIFVSKKKYEDVYYVGICIRHPVSNLFEIAYMSPYCTLNDLALFRHCIYNDLLGMNCQFYGIDYISFCDAKN